MAMHTLPHPGEFVTDIYLVPNGISGRELAAKLDVAACTLSRIFNGGIGPPRFESFDPEAA